MVAALLASLVALTIPQVLRWLVDGPLSTGDPSAVVAGRAPRRRVSVRPRPSSSRSAAGSCSPPAPTSRRGCATRCTRSSQDLPVAFHDRWPSGQLLSRAVSDLEPHPPLAVVRHRAARRQRRDDRRRLRHPDRAGTGCSALIFLVCSIPLWIYGFVFEGKYSVDRAPQPGPGRRPGDRRRGVGSRHPRAEGVRPRQARAQELRVAGRAVARHRDREGEGHRRHLALAAAGPRCRVRHLPGGRRVARVPGAADGRRAGRVLRDGDRAAVPDRVDRLPAVDDLRHAHGGRPLLRGASTRSTRSPIPREPKKIQRAARRAGLRRRALPLPGLAGALPGPAERHRASRSSRARRWRWSA